MIHQQADSDVRAAYDAVADTYANAFRSTEPEEPVELALIARFAELVHPPKRVLDVGCGAGRMMPVLAGLGCTVQGIDLSAEMIRRARLDHRQFPTMVGASTSLPYEDDSFDGAVYWYSTIHSASADLPFILAEGRRVLAGSGLVLLAFQSGSGERDVSDAYRRHGHEIALVRYLRTAQQMTECLTTAGFEVIEQLERPAAGRERDDQAFLIAAKR